MPHPYMGEMEGIQIPEHHEASIGPWTFHVLTNYTEEKTHLILFKPLPFHGMFPNEHKGKDLETCLHRKAEVTL